MDDLASFFGEVKEVESKAIEAKKKESVQSNTSSKKRSRDDQDLSDDSPSKRNKAVTSITTKVASTTIKSTDKLTTTSISTSSITKEATKATSISTNNINKEVKRAAAPSLPPPPEDPPPPELYTMVGQLQDDPHYVPTFKNQSEEKFVRVAGGSQWVDDTLKDWPENDFRLFIGDLGEEIAEPELDACFSEYKSYAMSRIVRTKWNNKSKGFGFVSFLDPFDCAKALREKNGKWLGSRPMKISKSDWNKRNQKEVNKQKNKKKKQLQDFGMI